APHDRRRRRAHGSARRASCVVPGGTCLVESRRVRDQGVIAVHPSQSQARLAAITRRHFYSQCGVGLGKIALASLLAGEMTANSSLAAQAAPSNPLAPRPTHYPAKAKAVIYLFMAGAPSQLELFDFKPALVKHDGQPIPPEIVRDQRYAF